MVSKAWKNFEAPDRKSLGSLEQNVARNINIRGASGEVSDRTVEYIIGN